MSNIITGGPDFSLEQHLLQTTLGQYQLSLRLPPFQQEPCGPKRLEFPFHKEGWLARHCVGYKQHQLLAIDHFYWPYVFNGQLIGIFAFDVELKGISKQTIDVFDLTALSNFLSQEYHDFFNAPDPSEGDYSGYGFNTWRRQSLLDKEPMIVVDENGEETLFDTEYKLRIMAHNLFPPLEPASILTIGDRNWVYYESFTSIGPFQEKDNLYCIPLSDDTLLQMRFSTKLHDLPDAYSAWQADAKAGEIKIMQQLTLSK